MTLTPGQRIETPNGSAYAVGECVAETPWYRLSAAKKIFSNYRYDDRQFYEAADDEHIEVIIRHAPSASTNNQSLRDQFSERLWFESSEVLAKHRSWMPESIDWIDRGDDSLLVMSSPRGQTLRQWRNSDDCCLPLCLRIAGEILSCLDSIHNHRQVIGGFGPDDFVIDAASRITLRATDRVTSADDTRNVRPPLPPERYPRGFSAPETLRADGPLDSSSDLYSWGQIFQFLMTGDAEPVAAVDNKRDAGIDRLTEALHELARATPQTLRAFSSRKDRRTLDDIITGWSLCVERCLDADPDRRPANVAALRRLALNGGAGPLRQGWRRLTRLFGGK